MDKIAETAKPDTAFCPALAICVRGQQFQKFLLTEENYQLRNAQEGQGECLFADCSLLEQVHIQFQKTENSYSFQVLHGQDCVWYNASPLSPAHINSLIELKDKDVLRIDQPCKDSSHPQAMVLIFHQRDLEQEQWRRMDLNDGKVKLYISRNEELASGKEEVWENSGELSRRYAILIKEKDSWYVEDHNTKFGVYVNNKKISGRQKIYALDVMRIGNTLFLYEKDTLYYSHKECLGNSLIIHIEERSVWNLFRKQVLLEDIDLTVHPGEMVLILGGSGAGKTTFLNAVMGYEKAKGRIMDGDMDVYRNYNQMKYEIGFVPQQDLLRMEDVVYDTLENAAELKMPRRTTQEERSRRIETVLNLFGLEREKDSLVSKLSGGQRKRLSIAVEFIADPSLFFLDEPDSGLDGIMSRSLMENLRVIADQEKIVLVITHSPDRAADLFDKVIVLAKSTENNVGEMAFYGSVQEALNFFETDTLEKVVRRINRKDEGGEGLADIYIKKYKQLEEQKI